jgi:hypothetical protein
VGEESDDQAVAVADPPDAVVGLIDDLSKAIAGEVGQLAALEVGPEALGRVQFRRIGGSRSTVSQSR